MCKTKTSGAFSLIGAVTQAQGPALVIRLDEDMIVRLSGGGKLTLVSGCQLLLPCSMQDISSVFRVPPMAAWSAWSFSRAQAKPCTVGETRQYWEVFLIAGENYLPDTATSPLAGSDDDDLPF